jgi:putative phosphoserine phosphatase/1-acylglycerol-3-phosphate O-acyltransferase
MVDVTGGVGSDLGLAVAGIDIDIVQGAEHLWSARPCVFVFNHQSKLDTIVVTKLLRSDFTGVAKKEAANVPGFGQFFRLAGVAFIDRSNPAKAREALTPAIEKLRDGMSLVLAPEGTRSATPRLGPFKKGAFHIAMQAGVPMVPIVLENAGELMWRYDQMVRPGTVRVVVHPPIETDEWRVETLDEHVAHVRGLFLETLGLAEEKEAVRP